MLGWRRRGVLLAVAGATMAACASSPQLPPGQVRSTTSAAAEVSTTIPDPTSPPASPPTSMSPTSTSTPTTTTTTTTTTTSSTLPQRDECEPAETLAGVTPAGWVMDGPWPRPAATAGPISLVPPELAGGTIHLGLDVEGDPTPLPAILDVLDQHRVKTTFFVQGQWAAGNRSLLQEIVERGHELASHAYGGDPLGEASDERIVDELTRTEDLIVDATGISTKPFFRPPNGDRTENSVRVAADAGWSTIHWSGGAGDFLPGATVDSMCASLVSSSRPGAILLAHTFNPEIPTVIDRYIRQMHRDDLVLVPLSVLLAGDPEAFVRREP